MKRIIIFMLCAAVVISSVSCTNTHTQPSHSESISHSEEKGSDFSQDHSSSDAGASETAAATELFRFNPKAVSAFTYEVYPEKLIDAWFNLVDAVYAGEDTFECEDEETYNWMIHQLPGDYFPVFTEIIEPVYGEPVKDGTASFNYKVSKEKAAELISDFEELVVDLLNKTMKPSYSDFENAISLYNYFSVNYTYDYDTENKMYEEYVDYTSCYRFMTSGNGICSEVSSAYTYLLMQAGIDATIVLGPNHQWSYIRLNGKNYHIDPTYALSRNGSLEYFLMTDEKRAESGFERKDCRITGNYAAEFGCPEYMADDDTFAPLWNGSYAGFDHDTHTLYYETEGEQEFYTAQFDYKDF